MKRFLASLLLIAGIAQAGIAPSSDVMTTDDAYALNRHMSPATAFARSLGTTLLHAHTTAYGLLDFTSGAANAQSGANATLNVGILMPAKAVLRQVWFDVITTVAPAGVTMAVNGIGTGDIRAATSSWSAGRITSLVTGAPSSFIKWTTASNITFTLTGSTATAGKVKVFADYVISE